MEALLFSLSAISPIVLMLLLGQFLHRSKMIGEAFVQQASALVFKVCLPVLLFSKMSSFGQLRDSLGIVLLSAGIFILYCLVLWLLSGRLAPEQRGVFVQGAYRSNTAIIGLALIQNSYGETADELAFLYVAVITIVANILAILVLNGRQELQKEQERAVLDFSLGLLRSLLRNVLLMLRNPLIVGTCLGLLYGLLFEPTAWLTKTTSYVARLSLPLALICIGATLRLKRIHGQKKLILLVCALKLIVLPVIGLVATRLLFGELPPMVFGVVFMMLSSPTAAASFVMVKQMGGDAGLAADIVAVTTTLSIFTSSLGLLLLHLWQLI